MPTRTAAPEIHFTRPSEWLEELRLDAAGDYVADRIVRLSVQASPATLVQVTGRAHDGSRPAGAAFSARTVEASYLSTRGQLVKLSAWAGVVWHEATPGYLAPQADVAAALRSRSAECWQRVEDTAMMLRKAIEDAGLLIRGGAFELEDRPWEGDPDRAIVSADREGFDPTGAEGPRRCATCHEDIYYRNGAWRHVVSRRAEAFDDIRCEDCEGRGYVTTAAREVACECSRIYRRGVRRVLNHLADPTVADRRI